MDYFHRTNPVDHLDWGLLHFLGLVYDHHQSIAVTSQTAWGKSRFLPFWKGGKGFYVCLQRSIETTDDWQGSTHNRASDFQILCPNGIGMS